MDNFPQPSEIMDAIDRAHTLRAQTFASFLKKIFKKKNN